MMTWSPTTTLVTPVPTCSTMPAPSWPSTAGAGQLNMPAAAVMSEWQTPAAMILTMTSPGPGSRTSSPSRTSAPLSPV